MSEPGIGAVRGAIIAGGGATRFGGRPKGLEIVGGERIIDRLVRVLTSALGGPPLLVANAADAAAWCPELRVVADVRPGMGSLGGIYTAVVETPAPVVCVAWDMPFVSERLVRRLAQGLVGADAVVPESGGRRGVEPLCAGYGPACRVAIEQQFDAGDLRVVGLLERVGADTIPLADVTAIAKPEILFFNVNTADDLVRAEALSEEYRG